MLDPFCSNKLGHVILFKHLNLPRHLLNLLPKLAIFKSTKLAILPNVTVHLLNHIILKIQVLVNRFDLFLYLLLSLSYFINGAAKQLYLFEFGVNLGSQLF